VRALELRDGELTSILAPLPGAPDHCLIRVRLAGICGTDLQLLSGYADFAGVPGHEFVGTVERTPPEAESWLGARVVGEINIACGDCARCRSGARSHCPSRRVLGIRGASGAFAEYVALPAGNLHQVPDALDDETAVFVEPVAAACRILEQVPDVGARTVAVLGDGRLGLLIAQVLRGTRTSVTLLGRHATKLDLARRLGLDARLPRPDDAGVFEVVVDATGRPAGFTDALRLVQPRGTLILKSTCAGETALSLAQVAVDEVTIVGSRCGPFERALEMLSSGVVDVRPLLSGVFPLGAFDEAFAAARGGIKVLLRP
jgi:alcohol dehydrogenase